MPLVSVITPAYNSEKYILESIESVIAQSWKDWEMIIVDDCSNDLTADIVKKISSSETRIKLIELNSNMGAGKARNIAIDRSRGDYIAFLDSDDVWHPDKLTRQIHFMEQKGILFSFTQYSIVTAMSIQSGKVVDKYSKSVVDYKDMLMKKATIGCSTVMLSVNDGVKLEMPEIRTGQDYALWLKLLRSGWKAHRLNDTLTQYRITPGSISSNKFKKARRQWEIYRDIEGIGMLKSMYYFCNYIVRALYRK